MNQTIVIPYAAFVGIFELLRKFDSPIVNITDLKQSHRYMVEFTPGETCDPKKFKAACKRLGYRVEVMSRIPSSDAEL